NLALHGPVLRLGHVGGIELRQTGQNHPQLLAGHRAAGGEPLGADTVHIAVFIGPGNLLHGPIVLRHVGKGQVLLFLQSERGLHSDLAAGHGKRVLVAALALELHSVAVLVGDSQLVQLIAIVGLDGDGHGIALVRPLGTDGDGAVLAVLHADGVITAAGGRGSAAGGSGISNRDLIIAHAHAAAAAQRDLVLIISVSIEVNGHALTGDRDLLVTILR
ncbi:Ktr system potassium uptake protein A, partial [Dysosmobacter welbionis]